eukprot:CAMPEP_0194028644 /NCGR_PEP_ID=MMETSP0009_2-20130614/2562_1 /TAXON_ID=210454 /ORGANISM="Grammatophora oceanica, Strain CCMP 410" /LENGTH=299 /DNA_ID=CAMNT_0038668089 /DNA_START=129 /DNA_END=1028 /DNA_ORIENTATION=-
MADKDIPVITGLVEATPSSRSSNDDVIVEVVAPMDLQEGYRLDVELNGETVWVKVPKGGVIRGQTFQARPSGGLARQASVATVPHFIPTSRWRDGLCDCCRFGCCHAMCCLGFCFEPLLMGQVATRMGRNICGGPGKPSSRNDTCKIIFILFILLFFIQMAMGIVMSVESCPGGKLAIEGDTGDLMVACPDGTYEEVNDAYLYSRSFLGAYSFIFGIYIFIMTCRTRRAIRDKYDIPAKCCGACNGCCEDFLCTMCCSCCTVQQMARHTNDYEKYDVGCCTSDCCNKRGQRPHIPEILV